MSEKSLSLEDMAYMLCYDPVEFIKLCEDKRAITAIKRGHTRAKQSINDAMLKAATGTLVKRVTQSVDGRGNAKTSTEYFSNTPL